nr:hypothetical protein F36H5.7 - Caenorhabditis elegans [Caenorhabditis elegans]
MLERDWISLCRHVQDGFIYVTLIVHTYMLYLIAYKSPKEIGKYKYLMVYVSIFEMAYATFGTVLKPVVLSYTSRIIVLVDARNIWLNRTVTRVINSAICGFYGCTASILTIHFMYRYGSLQMATSSIFEGWKFILLCLLPVCYGIIWSTTVFFVFPEDPGFSELIRNDMWDFFGIHVEDVVYTGMYYYKEDKYRLYGFEFLACFGMFILCFIITIVPLFLLYLPSSFVLTCPLFQVNLGSRTAFVTVLMSIYTVVDVLPNLFIIRNYRRATIGMGLRLNYIKS